MPDTTQQLIFKLVIDGKEAAAVLDETKGQFVEIGEAAVQANEQIKKTLQDSTSAQQKSSQGLQKLKDDWTTIIDITGLLTSIATSFKAGPYGLWVLFAEVILKSLIENMYDLKGETKDFDEQTKKTIESLKRLNELHKPIPITTYKTPENLPMVSPHQYKRAQEKEQEDFEKWVADYVKAMNKATEQQKILNIETEKTADTVDEIIKKIQTENEIKTLTKELSLEMLESSKLILEDLLKTVTEDEDRLKILKEIDSITKEIDKVKSIEVLKTISPPPVRGFDLQPGDSTELKLKAEEELMVNRVQVYDESEKQISNIRKNSARDRERIAQEESQAEINAISQTVGVVASSYNQIYNIMEDNARSEINTWKDKEAKKIEEEREAALKHAKTTAQKEKINEQFDARMKLLDEEAKEKETERLATWFAFQKALAIAQIAVQMAQAIAKGYGELGPIGGAIAMGVTVAALTAQAAAVAAQKFPEGFQKGGRLPKGKAGIFEGTHNEIVAPESDFKTYSAELTRQALIEARNYISVSSSSSEDLRAIKQELMSLREDFKSGSINARAYLDDREAKKIVSRGGAMNRRSKI